uniref:Carboxylesterase type B domain-containing protein n=1 Tax=Prolemur simus TaxID=1328070 RepID=A0A8C8Z3L1_PROSS
ANFSIFISLFIDAGLPVYLYEFKHRALTGIIVKLRTDGADHRDEIHFIFGSPFSKDTKVPPDTPTGCEEKALNLQMMKYWANFRNMNNPLSFLLLDRNPNGGMLPCWPRYDKHEKYLQLDFATSVGVKLKEQKMAFWTRLHQPQRPEKQRLFVTWSKALIA